MEVVLPCTEVLKVDKDPGGVGVGGEHTVAGLLTTLPVLQRECSNNKYTEE